MKLIIAICLSLLLYSCSGREKGEANQLRERVRRLEKTIDSIIHSNTVTTKNSISPDQNKSRSYSTPVSVGRCQAITKKGTPCKRKARSNGYCWQHGG